MAAHAYKQSVVELDDVIGRELVRFNQIAHVHGLMVRLHFTMIGRPVPHNNNGADRQDECIFSHCQRANQQAKQEGEPVGIRSFV